jgi:hypothetical protein
MFSALGCGGKAADDSQPAAPSSSTPRATPTSPPVASPPYRPQPAPMTPPPQQPPASSPPLTFRDGPDLAQAAVENVLMSNCGPCHGPALTPTQAQAGINYINDIDKLVEKGLIVPLSSATSRIILLMRNGTEPPGASGFAPVTDADIQVVASYIDNPRFWPSLVPAPIVDAGTDTPIVDAGADGG